MVSILFIQPSVQQMCIKHLLHARYCHWCYCCRLTSCSFTGLCGEHSTDPRTGDWCGEIRLGRNRRLPLVFQCHISVCPTVEKVQFCLHRGQNKGHCLKFLFHIKLSSLEPIGLLRVSVGCEIHVIGLLEQERALCSMGLYYLVLRKD